MFMFHRAWRHAYASAAWQQACSHPAAQERRSHRHHSMYTWSSGPTFGMRRPLRHLAWKLNLNETQLRDIVDVLDRLKTAYNQARLDQDRSTSEIAAAFSEPAFNGDRVSSALGMRTHASDVLNQELLSAVRRIFELLNEDQRQEFAYLLRSGAFVL